VAARRDFTRESLAAGVRAGDRRALARAITLVENSEPLAYEVVRDLYPETGKAYAVGVTGPPGVGKSSLISQLVRHVREQERSVGVISVDPSSPFTQGALLGDRIRLADHFLDPEVFIRSMAAAATSAGSRRRRCRRCSCSTPPARSCSSSRLWAPGRARSR
jgi:LAO/AO transport system kinase